MSKIQLIFVHQHLSAVRKLVGVDEILVMNFAAGHRSVSSKWIFRSLSRLDVISFLMKLSNSSVSKFNSLISLTREALTLSINLLRRLSRRPSPLLPSFFFLSLLFCSYLSVPQSFSPTTQQYLFPPPLILEFPLNPKSFLFRLDLDLS